MDRLKNLKGCRDTIKNAKNDFDGCDYSGGHGGDGGVSIGVGGGGGYYNYNDDDDNYSLT